MIEINIRKVPPRLNGGKEWIVSLDGGKWAESVGILASMNVRSEEKAKQAAKHLLSALILDACKALRELGGLEPIQEFGLGVLLEDPECQDAARDALGV
jgi:hypothetical protein